MGTPRTMEKKKTSGLRRTAIALYIALLAVAAVAAVVAWRHGVRWEDVQEAVRRAGAWGPAVCIVLLAGCTVSFVVTTPVVMLAGLLYGLPCRFYQISVTL